MSDIFENEIEDDNEDLSQLEDEGADGAEESGEKFVYNEPLYALRLDYSREGVFAKQGNFKLEPGDAVIIPTRYGKDLARVLGKAKSPIGIKKDDIIQIDRKASDDDLSRAAELKEKEKGAFKVFQEKVAARKLNMKLIGAHFLVDEPKALFFFSAEQRVDFRELVKDLVSVFKMRIELRQIGVRDESRITGGLGICGRPYCCHAISDKLRPVSIRMAKDQNLSLNSMKISGQCGRLLCCLSYEYDFYAESRKKLPNEGTRIFYDGTNFRITEINPLSSMIKLYGEDGRIIEINSSRFVKENNRWKIN
ncbi:MAG: hypothetical protein IJS51_02015 [Treponema sp.]|nr:hypothetical protein [Treponema sp.]MBQ7618886.1 hypothetical protein [Treponema sp.]